jgi:hypothetical protein
VKIFLMQTKDRVVNNRYKIHRVNKLKKSLYKNDLHDNARPGLEGSPDNKVFPDDLLDEILSKWLG